MNKAKLPQWVRNIQAERNNFWNTIYPQYTEKEKTHFWADEILATLRTQGETTGDEYSAFTKDWFERMRAHEPSLQKFLSKIFRALGNEIDEHLFYKRLGRVTYAQSFENEEVMLVKEPKVPYKVSRKKKK